MIKLQIYSTILKFIYMIEDYFVVNTMEIKTSQGAPCLCVFKKTSYYSW